MIGDFEIFPNNAFEHGNVSSWFDTAGFGVFLLQKKFITKEKLHFSLIYSFYCCLVKERWALKVA